MVLRSKRESHRTRKPEISICSETAASGESACARSPGKLLAQTPPLSQAPRPMNSSGRSQTCARVLVATVLFAAFSWTLLVSVSPQLHGCIHGDANRSDHVCAITLIASGSYEHGAQPPVISPPQFDVRFAASAELTSTWVKPLFLSGAHLCARAARAALVGRSSDSPNDSAFIKRPTTSGASHSGMRLWRHSRSGNAFSQIGRAHANPNFYRQLNFTKKISITFIALLATQSIVFSQTAVTASPSPATSPPGQAEVSTCGRPKSRNWISRAKILCQALARRVTPLGQTGLIPRRKAKTRRLTKRSCVSPVSRRIHSASYTSAANTPICNIASTTCSCRKVFRVSARNSRPVLPITFRSLPARCRRNLVFAPQA